MTTAELLVAHPADDAAERRQEARKVLWAFLGAIFLHLLAGSLLAIWSGRLTAVTPVEDKPIELTFVDLSTPVPIVPKNSMFVANDESKKAPEPKEKTFESNANSIAAAEIPATDTAPVPSQEGKDRPSFDMQTHQYSLQVDGAQPQPSTPPMQTPQPSQAPTAAPTPGEGQFAMLAKSPTPPPVEQSTPTQAQKPKSSYRPQRQQTRIRGNISNRGISSVNALGTPLGRYQKFLFDAIGSRWYASVEKQLDLFSIGTARITFRVDRDGRIQNLRVIDNTSNESFINYCIQAVQEAQVPPMSDDLAATLPPEGLEVELPFTIYAN